MNTQKLYRYVRQAVDRYQLIEPNDRIAVAVSGGKDSLVLLYALSGLKQFYPVPFTLDAITIDLGFGMSYEQISEFCQTLHVPFHLIQTQISQIVFEETNQKHPCSLCAHLRRGALINQVKELGCNKLALGHHRDDVIHTMMMSMLFEGRFYTFSPYTVYQDSHLALIRPLIYLTEGEIRSFAFEKELPIVKNICLQDGHSARAEMKDLLSKLSVDYPNAARQFFHAIENSTIDDWVFAHKRGKK